MESSSAEFPLLSLDGYSSGDNESSDPSSGNDEPMTRGRDRQHRGSTQSQCGVILYDSCQ